MLIRAVRPGESAGQDGPDGGGHCEQEETEGGQAKKPTTPAGQVKIFTGDVFGVHPVNRRGEARNLGPEGEVVVFVVPEVDPQRHIVVDGEECRWHR